MRGTTLQKHEYVFQQLEKKIAYGELKIGDLLAERELAAKFACSPGTVSKAVGRLVHEGLVERRTKVGTRVVRNTALRAEAPSLQLDACALIFPSDQHEGIWRIERGFQDAAREAQRRRIMLTTGDDFSKEAEIIGRLAEFDVKGAVIYPVVTDTSTQIHFMQMILASQFPVVLVELNLPGVNRPAVVADGLHAGYTVTKHLLSRGVRKIGFLSNYAWVPFMRDRHQGFRLALEEAGVSDDPKQSLLEHSMHPCLREPLREPTRIAKRFLSARPDLEGVVCANDFLAHGCLVAAEELGRRVPEQLKIVGIDDFSELPRAGELTTYHIPYEEMGKQAFRLLEACLRGESPANLEQQLRGVLVERSSC